jgi:hypothetical protein
MMALTGEDGVEIFGEYLFEWGTFWWGIESFLSIGLVALVVAMLCLMAVIRRAYLYDEIPAVLGAIFVVALFGGLVGFHGGNSRVGVVGDLIPAVVTLVAGFAAYLFGLPDKRPGPYMFPLLGGFIVTLFISWSMYMRNSPGIAIYSYLLIRD